MTSLRTDTAPLAVGRTIRSSGQGLRNEHQELGEIGGLSARLTEIQSRSSSLNQVLVGAMDLIRQRDAVVGSMMIRRSDKGKLSVASHNLDPGKHDIKTIESWLLPKATESLGKGIPVIASSPEDRLECIAVCTDVMDCVAIVNVVQWPIENVQRTIELSVAQIVATFLSSAATQHKLEDESGKKRVTAAVLELIQKLQQSTTIDQACLVLVSQLQECFQCDQVFVGISRDNKTCRVKAVSKMAVVDPNAETTLQMKSVLDEAIGRDAIGAWPPLPGTTPHQLLAHKQLAGRESLVLSTPLKDVDGTIVGAVAIRGRRDLATVPELKPFLSVLEEPVGETLQVVRRNQGGWVRRVARAVARKQHRTRQVCAAVAVVVIGIVLASPWPYTIRCQSVAEPMERRFCVAPHDGLIESTTAQPGDVVHAGQRLATLDGREILWDLAGVTAEKHRAETKRDSHLANYETPQAVMADLEVQTLENKRALLEFKESNLLMDSPIDGVILSGSLDRRENYPVSKGQVLYEVAPLEKLCVEVGVPDEEISHVAVGDSVTLWFEGFGNKETQATITRIRPRAEVREQDNVFVAEVEIDNPDRTIRPGMKATAKVVTDSKSVAWILFHHAVEKVRARWF